MSIKCEIQEFRFSVLVSGVQGSVFIGCQG